MNSADGRYVVFDSEAANLIDAVIDRNGSSDVFLYDRVANNLALVSRSVTPGTSSSSRTANAFSTASAISADGEWVLFRSQATDLLAGLTDNNSSDDVFLYQRSTGALTLVSRSAQSATMTANDSSSSTALSADGQWVLFSSTASDLVAGVSDNNLGVDVFLYQRSSGIRSLVSRSAVAAMTTANADSQPVALSADGHWVLFGSSASNLVDGVNDLNGPQSDGFLYERSTGALTLVSRSASSSTSTANGASYPAALSADGEWVLFDSDATNLVIGATDTNVQRDVFLYQRSSAAVQLISRSATTPASSANNASLSYGLSADGEWVLIRSRADDLVAGVSDTNSTEDVYLYQRSAGTMDLVSHSANSTTSTANGNSQPSALSADGEWVTFSSLATDLVSGISDLNGHFDAFMYQRSSGLVTLLSRSATSSNSTGNGQAFPVALSASGDWVLFASVASDLLDGVIDGNGAFDLYLRERSSGAALLVSRATAALSTAANSVSRDALLSDDGDWVLFASEANNLVAGVTDQNSVQDVYLYQRSSGAMQLVSRSATAATTTANQQSRPTAISADGEWSLFASSASNLVSGLADLNASEDVFIFQRSTGAVNLVSRSATSPGQTANSFSLPAAISADGEWVLFSSFADDLFADVSDGNGSLDVFLFQRSTGLIHLVSRSTSSATTTANRASLPAAVSDDGEWILLQSSATNLVSGINDAPASEDVFLFQRSSGAMTLISRSAVSAMSSANDFSYPSALSPDGEWVLFRSRATDLLSGTSDVNGPNMDAFLYQRSNAELTLVSRAASSASSSANGASIPSAVSADGEWVLFSSSAGDLVNGLTDANGSQDVFLYQRSSAAVSVLSHQGGSATETANGFSEARALSADGDWALFHSEATDLVDGLSDDNGAQDVFVYQRSRGTSTLISRSTDAPMSTATSFSQPAALSADGARILFVSPASDLVRGVSDVNGTLDVFVADNGADRLFNDGFEQGFTP